MDITFIFFIAVLIMSVVIHEVSHGYAAEKLGDPTARLAGRLTLNPVNHLDMMGSFIVPVIMYFTAGFVFGWAKPVPYNPYNLKDQRWGPAFVAVAGPVSNILIALTFGLLLRFSGVIGLPSAFLEISVYIVFINLLLAVFNLIPVPPLDGSKIVSALLPYRYAQKYESFQQYGIILFFFIALFAWQFIHPVIGLLFSLITGSPLSV